MIRKLNKEDISSCARIFVKAFSEAAWVVRGLKKKQKNTCRTMYKI